jgi:hypothetical protein
MNTLRPPGLAHKAASVPPLRGFGELQRPLATLLPLLFCMALAAGLALRVLGAQPEPQDLMNMLGSLCWLLGYALAAPLQRMLLRLDQHRQRQTGYLAARLQLLSYTVLCSIALNMALLPVHFGYDQSQALFTIETLNVKPFPFRSAYFLLILQFLAGPACLLLSTGLLRVLRLRLPAYPATLLWLAAGSLLVLIPAALQTISAWPFSLGQLSSWNLEFMFANKELASPYLQELLRPILLRIGLVWLTALLLLWISLYPAGRPWQRIRPLWLACCGALLVAGLRTLALTLRWTQDVLPLTPDGWWTILLTGTHTAWLIWLICCLTEQPGRIAHSFRRDAAWLLLLPAGLLGLTVPSLQADEAGRLTMFAGLLLLLPILLLGFLLPLQFMRLPSGILRLTALLALLVLLLLPLPMQSSVVIMLGYMKDGFSLPLPAAEQLRVWFCLLAIVVMAWPGLLSALLALLRRKPTATATQTP